MTGITVTRFAASGDTTHFSAEPSGVVIRGLPQVRSEFNGRDSFNANSSRGLSFGDVSPELMAGVDTYKNATADMIEGGIAGTVNLRTHVPFDSEGFVAAFSAELGYGTLAEEAKPAGSMLLSNRWDTGIGEFGVMANAAYSEVVTESQGVQLLRFFNADDVAAYGGGTKWIPGGIDIRENTYDRTRKGGSFATQWRSPEESLLGHVAVQPLRIREQLGRVFTDGRHRRFADSRRAWSSRNEFATHPAGTPAYEFDSRGVFVRGIINDVGDGWAGPTRTGARRSRIPNGYVGSRRHPASLPTWVCYCWTTRRSLPDHARRRPRRRYALVDADQHHRRPVAEPALGRQRTPRPQLRRPEDRSDVVNFDNSSNNKTAHEPRSRHQRRQAAVRVHASPRVTASRPAASPIRRTGSTNGQMEHAEDSSGEELAVRLDADIQLDDGWVDSLRVGVRTRRSRTGRQLVDVQLGLGAAALGRADRRAVLPQPGHLAGHLHRQGPGFQPGRWRRVRRRHVPASALRHRRTTTTPRSALYGSGRSNSWVALADRTAAPIRPVRRPVSARSSSMNVTEDTRAAYVMLKFGGDDTKIGNISVTRQHRCALGDDRRVRDRWRAVPAVRRAEAHGSERRCRIRAA